MFKMFKSGLYFNVKWLTALTLLSLLIGFCNYLFLTVLELVTNVRILNPNIIYFLPIAGFTIGFIFLFFGKSVSAGNNLLIDAFYNPKIKIPFLITPLIFIGTIITHLFGGSAGREGAGLQISAGFIDFFVKKFDYSENDKKILIKVAVAGGFSAVFGTPLAGILFALEFFNIGKPNFKGIISIIYVSFLANNIAVFLGAKHVNYLIYTLPDFKLTFFFYLLLCGFLFGLCSLLFNKSLYFFSTIASKVCSFLPFRLFFGGFLVLILVLIIKSNIYLGLGIETIQKSFIEQLGFHVFLLKFIFTIITLSFGFKGGEVTPLFFIGATLGSFLSIYIPLPLEILAAVGFVSVFAGSTNTPIACIIMAIELFGIQILPFALITCIVSYFCSGYSSIFIQQKITNFKLIRKPKYLNKRISQL